MNPMELIPAPPSETLEEMDYEAYLAFHGMEVLEGTPPQVIAAMVADVEAAKALDAREAERATLRAREAAAAAEAADPRRRRRRLGRDGGAREATSRRRREIGGVRAIRAVPGGRRGGDRARRGVRASRG